MKTDSQLHKDILDELSWDPAVHANDVGVSVKDGVVILSGHLASHAQKQAAERAVMRVNGVKAVANEMEVRLSPSDQRGDVDIAAAAQLALRWNAVIPVERIQLKVERGWVTLSGEVEWDYQRKAAEESCSKLLGVVGVSNLIMVKPQVSPIDVQQRIQAALQRQAQREAQRLLVIVDGSRVTLRGKVHSWAERQAAQSAAWGAPGISTVVNELTLDP